MRKVANLYAIVSMGVACFQWQPGATSLGAIPCKAEVFNIWLLSQRPYTIDPLSAKFLLKHGFDFNKQLLHGLPYDPVGVASEAGGVRAASGASEVSSLPICNTHTHYRLFFTALSGGVVPTTDAKLRPPGRTQWLGRSPVPIPHMPRPPPTNTRLPNSRLGRNVGERGCVRHQGHCQVPLLRGEDISGVHLQESPREEPASAVGVA